MNRVLKIGALAALLAASCALAAPPILVSADEYGAAWPLTIEEAHLLCLPGDAVVVSDPENGRMYPLNGIARAKVQQLGLDQLEAVWRADPENAGARVSVGALVERGLGLCAG